MALILLREWQSSQIEFWASIHGSLYEVSTFGNIRKRVRRQTRRARVRSPAEYHDVLIPIQSRPRPDSDYRSVGLWKNRRSRLCYVHRAAAEAFLPNPERLPVVGHLNGIGSDNRVDNLEWTDQKANIARSRLHGRWAGRGYMWIWRAEYEHLCSRITDLEKQLTEERAENRRTERWQANMLLRRAQTLPVPTRAEITRELEPRPDPVSRFSPDDVGKAQAIRDEGLRLIAEGATYTDADIEREVKAATGMTMADLRAAEIETAEESQSVS